MYIHFIASNSLDDRYRINWKLFQKFISMEFLFFFPFFYHRTTQVKSSSRELVLVPQRKKNEDVKPHLPKTTILEKGQFSHPFLRFLLLALFYWCWIPFFFFLTMLYFSWLFFLDTKEPTSTTNINSRQQWKKLYKLYIQ